MTVPTPTQVYDTNIEDLTVMFKYFREKSNQIPISKDREGGINNPPVICQYSGHPT